MRVECVTVCVGYADYLRETLVENLPVLDNIVVITAPDDPETVDVCRRHSVHCVVSEDGKRDGPFNKYRLIQRGIDQISGKDWVLNLDADMVLPRKFRQMLQWAHLDEKCIYGADRQNLVGWDAWQRFKAQPMGWDNHSTGCGHWFHPKYEMMSRWVSHLHGYCPVGYLQLFNNASFMDRGYHAKRFPANHGDAARCDIQFACQWDRRDRVLLPEVIALHLESEPANLGANWKGRTTKRFGPPWTPPNKSSSVS